LDRKPSLNKGGRGAKWSRRKRPPLHSTFYHGGLFPFKNGETYRFLLRMKDPFYITRTSFLQLDSLHFTFLHFLDRRKCPPLRSSDILFLQDLVWNFQGKVERSKSTFVLQFRYSLYYHWRSLITCPIFFFPSLFLPSTSSDRSTLSWTCLSFE